MTDTGKMRTISLREKQARDCASMPETDQLYFPGWQKSSHRQLFATHQELLRRALEDGITWFSTWIFIFKLFVP